MRPALFTRENDNAPTTAVTFGTSFNEARVVHAGERTICLAIKRGKFGLQ